MKQFDDYSAAPGAPASSGTRGRVGRSSVREMSRKFETVTPTTTTRTSPRHSGGGGQTYSESDDGEGSDSSPVAVGSGRSFLNDRTPVSGVSDLMDRMRWDPESSEEGQEGVSLLNKFLGAQVLMQGIEPMLKRGSQVRSQPCNSFHRK